MKTDRNILVTGANGYIGRLTIEALAERSVKFNTIIAHDVSPVDERTKKKGIIYIKGDIRSKELNTIIKSYNINTVVHLVSTVSSSRKENRELEYSVDVGGTENLLQACVANGVRQFIITSSGAAYGYYPDNPQWIMETDRLRGNDEFAYACHKRLVEEMLCRYRQTNPQMKQLILRPGTILGEHTDNQITRLFFQPFVLGIMGSLSPFVFIWDGDVVAVIIKGIEEGKKGIYNLAGDGVVTTPEIATRLHKPLVSVPAGLLKLGLSVFQKLGLTSYGPQQVNFLRYRPVLSNRKLKEEFHYTPKYSSREVFELFLKHHPAAVK